MLERRQIADGHTGDYLLRGEIDPADAVAAAIGDVGALAGIINDDGAGIDTDD